MLQSRLVQHGLRILDVGGAGDRFFRAVSHRLYGEPSYHVNVVVLVFNIREIIQKDSLKVVQTIYG